jgi:carboxypeptidase family protein
MKLTGLVSCLIPALAALCLAGGPQTTPPVISGVVRDDAGTAVAGVVVMATQVAPVSVSNPPPVPSRPSDASGRYAFESLGRGIYVFSVTVPSTAAPLPSEAAPFQAAASVRGDSPAGVTIVDRDGRAFVTIAGPVPAADGNRIATLYAPVFHGGATVLTRAQLVQVDPDRPRTGIDIVLPRKPAVRVAGVLTTAPPRGAIDAGGPQRLVVRLLPADTPVMPPRGAMSDALPIATALADESGAFVFPAVPTGEYVIDAYRPMPPPTVRVSSKGVPVVTPPDRVDGDPQGLAAAQAVTLERDVDDLRMMLRGSGPASRAAMEARAALGQRGGPPVGRSGGAGAGRGRALPGGPPGGGAIAGRLTDGDGTPLPGVQIFAAQARGNDLLPMGSAAISDADGRYRLGGLSPGSYAIVAPSIVQGIRGIDLAANAFPPPTASEGGKIGYVTTFHPATPDAGQATLIEISGHDHDGIDLALQRRRVSDLTGAIARADFGEVYLVQPDRRAQLGGRNVLRTRLMPGGKFLFRDVPEGHYTLKYDSPAGWARVAVTLPESATGPLAVSTEQYVSVSGRVMIEEDALARGATLPAGLTVRITQEQLTPGDAFSPATVQPDGTFVVPRVVPGQRYFLRVLLTPPWRQTAGFIDGEDAFSVALTITKLSTDARVVITNR